MNYQSSSDQFHEPKAGKKKTKKKNLIIWNHKIIFFSAHSYAYFVHLYF